MEQPSILASLLPIVAIFAIFYFLVIMPQKRQQKKHKIMIDELKKGDKIVTAGGLHAEVVKAEETFIKVELAKDVVVRVGKEFVSRKIEPEIEEKKS